MELTAILIRRREDVLREWFERIVSGYPANASAFLTKQKDRFRNPVGHAISAAIGPIYDQVLSQMDVDVLREALDPVVRIRSVQSFTPSEAVGFVFELKAVIRSALDEETDGVEKAETLEMLEARIDRVALLAFDKYTECREQLHAVRANEMKARWGRVAMRSMGVASKDPPEERADK